MKKVFIYLAIIAFLIIVIAIVLKKRNSKIVKIPNYEECIKNFDYGKYPAGTTFLVDPAIAECSKYVKSTNKK